MPSRPRARLAFLAVIIIVLVAAGSARRHQLFGAPEPPSPRAAPWIEVRAPGAFGAEPTLEEAVTYRVDATVLLPLLFTAVPLASRDNVGIGSFAIRDLRTDSGGVRALEFFAASDPERARGLNRLGFLREVTSTTRGEPVWTAHFGVVSANPEESREAAEEALDRESGLQPYSVIDGIIERDEAASAVTRLVLDGRWADAADLYEEVRPLWTERPPDYERHIPNQPQRLYQQPLGFLGALQSSLQAIAADTARDQRNAGRGRHHRYVHNGRVFRFEIRAVTEDRKRGAAYAAAGWVTDPAAVRRVDYRILDDRDREVETFRIWVELPPVSEDGGLAPPIVPVAFEFRPRAFLELRAVRSDLSAPARALE